ncbi:hypothetical protein BJ138DRAFT_840023 [Hygrophoropsis aurantiaca]|uniref:Uncharacterized protein n=1 Tax=Hygrophoropsis aurantiaca TaxID=72124 RepID=A0ACB7ZVB5_9AGAM|nr:hypothetical protein BJ138DRAFT_840023 [Hygrophoropsis aurantiaca]
MNFMTNSVAPSITLTPTTNSFPFPSKRVTLSQNSTCLASELLASRNAAPVSISTPHAEVWIHDNQVLIRDRRSSYGTLVNGVRIDQQTLLRSGDVVTLGARLARSSGTPSHITEDQLKPIEATVTLIGL